MWRRPVFAGDPDRSRAIAGARPVRGEEHPNVNPQIRKPLIAGNWKMYKTIAETQAFFDQIAPLVFEVHHCEMVIAAPFTALRHAAEFGAPLGIGISGQDLYWEKEGAFTGEVSA